jgi:hypothetical protein
MHFYMHSYLHKIFILVKSGCYRHWVSQNVGYPLCRFIPRSSCFGQFWPTMGFTFEPWALADLTTIVEPTSNTVAVFLWHIGCIIWGVGWCVKSFLLHLFTTSAEPRRFASSAVTPWGYKASLVTPRLPTSSQMISLYSSTSFPKANKRKK